MDIIKVKDSDKIAPKNRYLTPKIFTIKYSDTTKNRDPRHIFIRIEYIGFLIAEAIEAINTLYPHNKYIRAKILIGLIEEEIIEASSKKIFNIDSPKKKERPYINIEIIKIVMKEYSKNLFVIITLLCTIIEGNKRPSSVTYTRIS